MKTSRQYKLTHNGTNYNVQIREVHDDAPEGASWRERMQQTRTYWGRVLYSGTWDECQKWIKNNPIE